MSTRKQRKYNCSSCGQLARDHLCPVGRKCNESNFKSDNEETRSGKGSFHGGSSQDSALHKLADQMGKLTLTMQSMQEEIHDVKHDIKHPKSNASGTPNRIASDYMSDSRGVNTAMTYVYLLEQRYHRRL
jgi:hypothetical protein